MKTASSTSMNFVEIKKHAAMLSSAERSQLVTFLNGLEAESAFQETINQRMKVMDAGLKLIREEVLRHERELRASRLSP